MSNITIVILLAALVIVPSTFYLRAAARRVGLPRSKEPWPVLGVFVGAILVWGIDKDNVWLVLIGFLAVVSHLVHQACRVRQATKKNPNLKEADPDRQRTTRGL